MRDMLDAVSPWMPEVLFSPRARARLQALAARLPAVWSWGLLECRLASGDDRVDFMVCTSGRDASRRRLRDLLTSRSGEGIPGVPGLLLAEWVREGSWLHREVPVLWLEYDLPAEQARAPLVSLCADPSYLAPEATPRLTPAELRATCARGLALALGCEPEAGVLRALEHCAEQLPPEGRILQVASLQPRGTHSIRLLVNLPASRVMAWLQAVEWPGSERQAEAVLAICCDAGAGWVDIHVDVAGSVGAYFAAERPLPPAPDAAPANQRLFERLIEQGLCAPGKAEAALGWNGREVVDLAGAQWLIALHRRSYIKAAAQPGGSLEAKAYLGFRPRFTLW